MRKFGLIGKNIDYSFSRKYFAQKFKDESIDATYVNFDCESTDEVKKLFSSNQGCSGFNVTIPYKRDVISLMDKTNKHAEAIGAVNTIKCLEDGKLKGFNTDYIGFKESIKPLLTKQDQGALILGTGGASKAIGYAFELLDISHKYVSRTPQNGHLAYEDINPVVLSKYSIIVNCSPIGTFPKVDEAPRLPYHFLGAQHLLYDLVYNPKETLFLKKGKQQGARICNGLEMLKLQAEASWRIWNL